MFDCWMKALLALFCLTPVVYAELSPLDIESFFKQSLNGAQVIDPHKIVEREFTHCSQLLEKSLQDLASFVRPALVASVDETHKALTNPQLSSLVERINNLSPSPASEPLARSLYNIIDDLLAHFIDFAKTQPDDQGSRTEFITQQAMILRNLDDTFKLASYFADWWRGRPASLKSAKAYLDASIGEIEKLVILHRQGIYTELPFKRLLERYVHDVTMSAQDLVIPLANLSRSWHWYQALTGSRSYSRRPFAPEDVPWWLESAHIAQELLRRRDVSAPGVKDIVKIQQNIANALARLDLDAINAAETAYHQEIQESFSWEDPHIHDLITKTRKFIAHMQELRSHLNNLDKAKIIQELTSEEIKKFIDSYARRDELSTLPPAKAYEEDVQQGAKVLYDYIDRLLAQFIYLAAKNRMISVQDLDFMQHIYGYLAALDEEYGLNKGWFGFVSDAESQLKAEEYLNEILMAAYTVVRSANSTANDAKELLKQIENGLAAYKKVGGVPNDYVVNIIVPKLLEKSAK